MKNRRKVPNPVAVLAVVLSLVFAVGHIDGSTHATEAEARSFSSSK